MRRAFLPLAYHYALNNVADQCRRVAHPIELVKPHLSNVANMRHAPGVGSRPRIVSRDHGYVVRKLFRLVRELRLAFRPVGLYGSAANCGIVRPTILLESTSIRGATLLSHSRTGAKGYASRLGPSVDPGGPVVRDDLNDVR